MCFTHFLLILLKVRRFANVTGRGYTCDEVFMPDNSLIESRKADHIRINLEEDVQSGLSTGLENYRFIHEALPNLNLRDVNLSQELFGKKLRIPILISSMTGGTKEAFEINTVLAQVAEQSGLAMGVGSQRVALEKAETRSTFQVRKYAPNTILLANIGAVQLNYGLEPDDCQKAVDMVEADALILHLNPLQEALQVEGDTNFSGLLGKIESVCRRIKVPVIVKEVGWGISGQTAEQLANVGVNVIDVAGAGGTSWSQVELFRMDDQNQRKIAGAFRNWGIPTAESIQVVKKNAPGVKIFASGGIRDGIDIAKCIALGAEVGGLAGAFLKVAINGYEDVSALVDVFAKQIQISMFATGVKTLEELRLRNRVERID